jgi:EpsI family protein
MNIRIAVLVVLFLITGLGRWQLQAVEPAPASDLSQLPLALEDWVGRSAPDLDPEVIRVLGADDYLNRYYTVDGDIAGLFVGYHRSQRFGSTIHSPLNCLPGAGWQPLSSMRLPFGEGGTVNHVLIEKGEDRQVVIYWYQTATRVEGNEYWSKLHLVTDAFTSRRNDAALVRVIARVDPTRPDGEEHATRLAYHLAELVQPRIADLLFPRNL